MTRIVDDLPCRVRILENVWIPMPDGCRLAAKIWLPEGMGPAPAILEYIPYRKRDRQAVGDAQVHGYVAGHGYACVRLDIRGSGDSDGVLADEYLKGEQDDALAAIAWIAAQPWCDGRVGMMGISWGGFNSLQVAARRPPALKAIITVCSTDDRYADDMHYMGGALLMDTMGWGATFFGYLPTPPDPMLVGDRWRAMWHERLEAVRPPALAWIGHQTRDAYWKQGSVCEDLAAIQVPVFAIGGWADGYSNAIPRLMRGLATPRRALVGPWGHCYPYENGPGPLIGFLQECVRWWDHWLKGRDSGMMAEPMVRAWMQASERPRAEPGTRGGRWVAEDGWSGRGDGLLTLPLGADGPALAIASPPSTGMASSDWCPYGLGPDMPLDQRGDDGGSLCFDMAPLTEALEILGAPEIELDLEVDRPNAIVTVRLCDVFPDGTSVRVTYGVLNLTHRDGHESPRPMRPGERTRVRVVLRDVGYAFPAGHRVRVAVSTAYWPVVWPAPEPVTLRVHPGSSRLALPRRAAMAADAALPPFGPAECARGPAVTVLRQPTRGRQVVSRDVATGGARVVSARDRGMTRLDAIDLTHEGWGEDAHTIRDGDPLSARTETRRRVGYSRGTWRVRIETRTALTADRDAFHLAADLDAYEGGDRVFTRSWSVAIPRNGV